MVTWILAVGFPLIATVQVIYEAGLRRIDGNGVVHRTPPRRSAAAKSSARKKDVDDVLNESVRRYYPLHAVFCMNSFR
jgi:hypothetical protein